MGTATEAKRFDVAVVGELNIDIILNGIEQFPAVGKEVLANTLTVTTGSSSAIFACNLSTLGTRVAFCGKLGCDDFGRNIIASLKARGVDTSHVLETSQRSTGATIVLNFGEDRAMVTHPGAMEDLTLADVPESLIRQSRHLHVSSVFLQPGLKKDIIELFRVAKKHGLTTSLDPQWDPFEKWDVDFRTLLAYVDVFLPNASELRAITSLADINEAAKSLPFANILVVKNGSSGALLWKQQEQLYQPAFVNPEVVDSIGAGDSFDAGFLHKFVAGRPLKECLEFAALTGAINTTRAGGTTAFENINTVKQIAETHFQYTF